MSGNKEEPLKRTTMVHLTGRYAFPAAKPPVLGSKTTGVRVEEMRIGAALSTDPDPAKATTGAVEEARSRLGSREVSLTLVVASRHHASSADVISEAVRVNVRPEGVIGCIAETVVGGDREVQDGP